MARVRNMEKVLEEYKQFTSIHKNKGYFFFDEVLQIKKLVSHSMIENRFYEAIGTALEAGYMIGYRTAKRDARKTAHSTVKPKPIEGF